MALLCALTLAPLAQLAKADAPWTYQYKMVENHDRKVCGHMGKVYRKYFRKPFDFDHYVPIWQEKGPIPAEYKLKVHTRYSFYPSSPEFDAISWRRGSTRDKQGDRVDLIWADIDIRNRGVPDTVVKFSFLHSSGGEDRLAIMPAGSLDVEPRPSFEDIWRIWRAQQDEINRPWRVIRPFLLDGVIYLSVYDYEDDFDDLSVHKPPETMTVARYRDGVVETVCRFDMRGNYHSKAR